MPGLRRLLPIAAVLALAAAAGPARADQPGAWVAGLGAGGGLLRVDGQWRPGAAIGAEARYGLTEVWSMQGALHLGWHPGDGEPAAFPRVQTGTAAFGLAYAWDVLRLVPFAEAGVVLAVIRGRASGTGGFAGAQLGAGLDYLLDRKWSIGGALRFQHLALGVGTDATPADAPMALTLLVRLDRRL